MPGTCPTTRWIRSWNEINLLLFIQTIYGFYFKTTINLQSTNILHELANACPNRRSKRNTRPKQHIELHNANSNKSSTMINKVLKSSLHQSIVNKLQQSMDNYIQDALCSIQATTKAIIIITQTSLHTINKT